MREFIMFQLNMPESARFNWPILGNAHVRSWHPGLGPDLTFTGSQWQTWHSQVLSDRLISTCFQWQTDIHRFSVTGRHLQVLSDRLTVTDNPSIDRFAYRSLCICSQWQSDIHRFSVTDLTFTGSQWQTWHSHVLSDRLNIHMFSVTDLTFTCSHVLSDRPTSQILSDRLTVTDNPSIDRFVLVGQLSWLTIWDT